MLRLMSAESVHPDTDKSRDVNGPLVRADRSLRESSIPMAVEEPNEDDIQQPEKEVEAPVPISMPLNCASLTMV